MGGSVIAEQGNIGPFRGRTARANRFRLPPPRDLNPALLVAIATWSGCMVVLSVRRGVRHDYVHYLKQWSLVRSGGDPWSGGNVGANNTYGPLHNVLAYLAELDPLAPKVLMVGAFLLVNLLLLRALLRTTPSFAPLLAYALFVPTNFLVISVVASFGLNDGLVAALVGSAILARFRGRLLLAGAFLGLAILLKYYPALLLPFICLDRRQIHLQPLVVAAATTALGLALSFAVWGDGVITALIKGVSRGPNLLSVVSAIRRNPELGGNSAVVEILVEVNAVFVLLGVAIALVLTYRLRLSWIEGATMGGLVFLLIYKVGHPQFYLPMLFLLVGLLICATPRSMYLAYCCLPYVLFLSVFQFGYEVLTDGYRKTGSGVRENVGFVAFLLGVTTILFFLAKASRTESGGGGRPSPVPVARHGDPFSTAPVPVPQPGRRRQHA